MKMSNELFYGSIDVTSLLEQANKKHSGFSKGKNGRIYAAVNIWLNAEADKYGNTISVQLQSTKEKRDSEPKIYFGNAKKADNTPKPLADRDVNNLSIDSNSIPERQTPNPQPQGTGGTDVAQDSGFDDLPF